MTVLLDLDQQLFEWINQDLGNPVLDSIMPWWREKNTWIPLYILLLLFSIIRFKWRGLLFVLTVIIAVSLSDLVSSQIMKPTFERLRPCNDPVLQDTIELRAGCGRAYSFTSSHAANHFAVATVIALLLGRIYRWIRWPFYIWAATISFGQVYVGVHYPTDILVGGLIGWIIGNIVAKTYLRVPARWQLPQRSAA